MVQDKLSIHEERESLENNISEISDKNEERMRVLANLIIDRVLKDSVKGKVRYGGKN